MNLWALHITYTTIGHPQGGKSGTSLHMKKTNIVTKVKQRRTSWALTLLCLGHKSIRIHKQCNSFRKFHHLSVAISIKPFGNHAVVRSTSTSFSRSNDGLHRVTRHSVSLCKCSCSWYARYLYKCKLHSFVLALCLHIRYHHCPDFLIVIL